MSSISGLRNQSKILAYRQVNKFTDTPRIKPGTCRLNRLPSMGELFKYLPFEGSSCCSFRTDCEGCLVAAIWQGAGWRGNFLTPLTPLTCFA